MNTERVQTILSKAQKSYKRGQIAPLTEEDATLLETKDSSVLYSMVLDDENDILIMDKWTDHMQECHSPLMVFEKLVEV